MSENRPCLPQTRYVIQFFVFCFPGCSELHCDFRSRSLRIDMGDQNKRTSFAGNTFVQIIIWRQGTSLTFQTTQVIFCKINIFCYLSTQNIATNFKTCNTCVLNFRTICANLRKGSFNDYVDTNFTYFDHHIPLSRHF